MKKVFIFLTIIFGFTSLALCQDTTIALLNGYTKVSSNGYGATRLVKPQIDTVFYSGKPYLIKYPKDFIFSDTAFTTIYFTGNENSIFDREIGLLIGNYKSQKPTFYVDQNGNNNYGDDELPLVLGNDSTLDLFFINSEYTMSKFGIRLFYPSYKMSDQTYLSKMGPLARKNEFASIEYWLGAYRLNNRTKYITMDSFDIQIGLHDYNCNGIYNDVGKDKVIFGNMFDSTLSTRLQHGAITISDTTSVMINSTVYDVRDIAIDGGSLTLIKCLDSCPIVKKVQNGMKLSHTAIVGLDSSEVYLDEIQESNKYMLIDVWGLWCKACSNQLPRLEKLYEENAENLQILSLNWGDRHKSVYKYLDQNPSLWQDQAFATKEFIKEYMVDSFPNYILVGKDGVIIKLGTSITEVKGIINK